MAHIAKTLILGLGLNILDVSTDIDNAIYHLQPKNVTRNLSSSAPLPPSCLPLPPSGQYECEEEHPLWAGLTLAALQLPGWILFLCATTVLLTYWRRNQFPGCSVLAGLAILPFVPFPLVVVAQLLASLFIRTKQMALISVIFLFLEGCLEAFPQLLLLGSITFSDKEREVVSLQITSMVSSTITILKTCIEVYCAESYALKSSSSSIMKHSSTLGDSLMKDKTMTGQLVTVAKITPAFVISLVHRVGSLVVICSLLREFSLIYITTGLVISFLVSCSISAPDTPKDVQLATATFYSLCNVATIAKFPVGSRSQNYPHLMAVSLVWLCLHSLCLLSLLLWLGLLPPSTHPVHWTITRLDSATVFYPVVVALLVLGPLSLLAVRGLKGQPEVLQDEYEKGKEEHSLEEQEQALNKIRMEEDGATAIKPLPT